jgi:predicted molibdopterin-dependent oxidoreductase YjgC
MIFSGTTTNSTVGAFHWALPTAAYVEKDGTFVNCHGRIQRVGRCFPPLAESREDWSLLLDLARQLDIPLPWRNPQEIFAGLSEAVRGFEGVTYEGIGSAGTPLPLAASTIDLGPVSPAHMVPGAAMPLAGGAS